MILIHPNLYIGKDADCIAFHDNPEFAIVHACKTCHMRVLNYKKSLPKDHPNYYFLENENHIYLNLLDLPKELSQKYADPKFLAAIRFIDKHISTHKVLIHCNQGQSRSTSVGLVYLAKNNIIRNDTYRKACNDFIKLYPKFKPNNGVKLYVRNNWNSLVK